jgi:hypothetical protein
MEKFDIIMVIISCGGVSLGNRGIMSHGAFKTFLTRGAFRSVFKPMLYKKEDHIHHDFIDTFLPFLNNINLKDNQTRFIAYWLYIVPKELFEKIFIADEKGEYYLTAVKYSDLQNGTLCAYYSQAMAIWHLEQILKNSEDYRNTVGLTIADFEYVLSEFYGAKNLTMQYLNEIRTQFDLSTMQVDPRDWGVHYVYNIYDLLINDEQVKYQSLNEWDKNIVEKMSFITFFVQFFADSKERSLAVLNS